MEYKLIEAVQMFPCLFDKTKQDYRNKLKKEKSWSSVATATGATVEQCQNRWRSLRDRYVREVSSIRPKSGAAAEEKRNWCYLESMAFFQKHIAPRRTLSNINWGSPEEEPLVETEFLEGVEDASSSSLNTAMMVTCSLGDFGCNNSVEEETPTVSKNISKRRRVQNEAHDKFEKLCGTVSDLIAAKASHKESRNADFLKVLDSYLIKHSEEEQDRLKIEILNLVYKQ